MCAIEVIIEGRIFYGIIMLKKGTNVIIIVPLNMILLLIMQCM